MFIFFVLAECLNYYFNFRGSSLLLTCNFAFVVIAAYIFLAVKSLRKVIIAPEGIIIKYMLINKKITIEYENIVSVKNLRMKRYGHGFVNSSFLYLEIELASGEIISINDNIIDNYDEIKEAIRRERFSLDYKKIYLKPE